MNILDSFLPLAETLVNKLSQELAQNQIDLIQTEKSILEFVYRIGHHMLSDIITDLPEPTVENRLVVDGKVAVYKDSQRLRVKNRFGKEIVRFRRRYSIKNEAGGYYPLDEKLGLNHCLGFTPLMTFLLSFFGGNNAFGSAAEMISESLGFSVSATAVQNNTESVGKKIDDSPIESISAETTSQECDLMVVEIDGTTSPQIHQEEGITGRESMKQPTEYKECNVAVIEKWKDTMLQKRWTGARYGKRIFFENHVRQAGLKMGQLNAKKIAFIADGAKHNWDIQTTNFPDAIAVLDFYHASEHLSDFCKLYSDKKKADKSFNIWKSMMLKGEILQILEELKKAKDQIEKSDLAQKEINYFENNKERMQYDQYKKENLPIGSGLVEGSCKFVVGKRFKGNGMRWKKEDNELVLKVRLASINNQLADYLKPKPRIWAIPS